MTQWYGSSEVLRSKKLTIEIFQFPSGLLTPTPKRFSVVDHRLFVFVYYEEIEGVTENTYTVWSSVYFLVKWFHQFPCRWNIKRFGVECWLWNDKKTDKKKTYKWVCDGRTKDEEKLKMRNLHDSHTLGCATPPVIHTWRRQFRRGR